MVLCEYCGERMTSAPSHMEHTPACRREKAWEAIDAYVKACGGYPDGKRAGEPVATAARAKINALLDRR